MTDTAAPAMENERPWRVGRKVGRTIYLQLGPEPSDADPLIGMMDSPEIAAEAVAAHNVRAARPRSGRFVLTVPDLNDPKAKGVRSYGSDPEYIIDLLQAWSGFEARWEEGAPSLDRRGLDGHCPSCSCIHDECGYVVNSLGCEAAHEAGGSKGHD